MDNEIIYRQYEHNSNDFRKALILRFDILSRKRQAGDFAVQFIYGPHEEEKNHILLGAFIDDRIIATLNMEPLDPTTFFIRQFAVDNRLQGRGIGMKLLMLAHETAKAHGCTRITMHARRTAYGFYKKAGYTLENPEDLAIIMDPDNTKFSTHHMYINL